MTLLDDPAPLPQLPTPTVGQGYPDGLGMIVGVGLGVIVGMAVGNGVTEATGVGLAKGVGEGETKSLAVDI